MGFRSTGVWFLWIFPIIGAALLIYATFSGIRTMNFLKYGSPGVAQVVGYTEGRGSKGGTVYTPKLRLIDPPVDILRGTGTSSSDRKWKVGTKMRVKYAEGKPEGFLIDSADDALLEPMIAGVIGAVFLIMGLVFLFIFAGPKDEVIWEPEVDMTEEQMAAGL